MIRENDLRVGNCILDESGIMVKVECIESKYFNNYDGGGEFQIKFSDKFLNIKTCDLSYCTGILLTEEILLKCGYIKNLDTGNYVNKLSVDDGMFTKMVIELDENVYLFCIVSNNYDSYDIRIDFLHQLQNLYFALTGQELEVKL